MQFRRETILEMIRMRGDDEGALERANESLPEEFEAHEYAGELEKLGIRPEDLEAGGLPSAPSPAAGRDPAAASGPVWWQSTEVTAFTSGGHHG